MLDNFLTLLLILLPLVVGFIVPIPERLMPRINQLLGWLVYVILLFIGLSLSQVQNLGSQLGFIITHTVILAICCMGSCVVSLIVFDKLSPWQRQLPHERSPTGVHLVGNLIQMGCVALGFGLGRLLPTLGWSFEQAGISTDTIIKGLLMVLILLVGFVLAHSGMTLKQVLMNKRGVQVSVIFCVSVAIGGMVFGLIMPDVGILQGLAMSSGYGWYSLSGIVMTDAYGAIWGSVALLNDLSREFVALFFIPLLMRKFPSAAVGLGGVTSMDFTLPVIQSSGGNEVVPLAMSFGFVVNVISPILMVVFSSLG